MSSVCGFRRRTSGQDRNNFHHSERDRFQRHTHTRTPFNVSFPGLPRQASTGYQKGKSNLDFTEARDTECQCYQLGHMQVCTSLQTDNHASTPPLSTTTIPTTTDRYSWAGPSSRSASWKTHHPVRSSSGWTLAMC